MKFMKDEEAVSPVIGVILMVAITVILAAVIAAFVFGMGSGVAKTKNVAVTGGQIDDTTIEITLSGGQDVDTVSAITWTVNGSACPAMDLTSRKVGATAQCTLASTSNDHVVAIASFTDANDQVVLDTYY